MSDSAPRRQMPRATVPVNYETGFELSEAQWQRMEKLREATETLYQSMHEAEGSTMPGEHQEHTWSSTRMRRAAEAIEMGLMLARKAALEAK